MHRRSFLLTTSAAVLFARAGRADAPFDITTLKAAAATTLFTVRWGKKPGQLGHSPAQESAPLAPTSFAVDVDGTVHVLDHVNDRISVFSDTGKHLTDIALGSKPGVPVDWVDLAVLEKGHHAVVDRVGARLVTLDGSGGVAGTKSFARDTRIPTPTFVTSLLMDDSAKPWLEIEQGRHIRLEPAKDASDIARFTGTPAQNRKVVLSGRREKPTTVRIDDVTAETAKPFAALAFPRTVAEIQSFDVTRMGGLWISVLTVEERRTAPFDVIKSETWALEIAPDGVVKRRVRVPSSTDSGEVQHGARVGRNGTFYAMIRLKNGVTFVKA